MASRVTRGEPLVAQGISPEAFLAAAVVRQAFTDLEDGKAPLSARTEAYDFLTRRLWDVESLWGQLLDGMIGSAIVCRMANQRAPQCARKWPR